MKFYWVYYVIRDGETIRSGRSGSYGSYSRLDNALKLIERLCEKYDVILTWINEVDENNDQRTVWTGLHKNNLKAEF